MTIKQLADLIEANPTCHFVIDNDQWWIENTKENDEVIASSDDMDEDGDWYSGGNLYGASLAAALVEIANRKGLRITAGPC